MRTFILLFGIIIINTVWTDITLAQDTIRLTLQETIDRAKLYSSDAITARHSFRSSYWRFRSHKAGMLPSVSLSTNPILTRAIQSVTMPDGTESYVHRNQMNADARVSVSQKMLLTGGTFSVNSSLSRIATLSNNKSSSYRSIPVNIGYSQNLSGFNSMKWQYRIEPLRYQEAKKNYIEMTERVAATAVSKFFNVVIALSNKQIAQDNFHNAERLYQIAEGRYNKLGTITESEMLQVLMTKLNEENNLLDIQTVIDNTMMEFRYFLGLPENVVIELLPSENIPSIVVDPQQALELAYQNNADITAFERARIEAESSVAEAKAKRRLDADFYIEFGLSQSSSQFREVYNNPIDQQVVRVGLTIPIIDWGVRKGNHRLAESSRDRVLNEVEQSRVSFNQNIKTIVSQFNLQPEKIKIALIRDQTAQRRHEVAQKLFIMGESTMLDLSEAIQAKDNARKAYMGTLADYWRLYYLLRSLTGYDFENQSLISEDFKLLID